MDFPDWLATAAVIILGLMLPAMVLIVSIFLNIKLKTIHELVNSRLTRIEEALAISEAENVELRREAEE